MNDDIAVVESGKAEPDDIDQMLKARIPLSNNPRKAQYLAYRATGFSVRESCALAEVTFATVLKWRREDEEFLNYENHQIGFLQSNLSGDLLRLEFMRNLKLVFRRDFKVLFKANYNFEGLTEHERSYLHLIRKHYGPQELLALERALEPEHGDRPPIKIDKAVIVVDGQQVESEEAKRAGSRALLDKFRANAKYIEEGDQEDVLEGEVVSGNGDRSD